MSNRNYIVEWLASTRFIIWMVHNIVWPVECTFGFHFYPIWSARFTKDSTFCLRCGKRMKRTNRETNQ